MLQPPYTQKTKSGNGIFIFEQTISVDGIPINTRAIVIYCQ